jgi:hypothetical protein
VTIETKRSGAFDSDLAVKEHGRSTWSVLAPLIWTGTKGDTFAVPVGFVTDFATVPRFLVWKVLPYGPYTRAAVLHDWLLVQLAEWAVRRRGFVTGAEVAAEPPANSRDCDGIFRRVMEDLGVPWMTRWQMWAAVRVGALFNSRRAYGRNFTADAPRVIGILLVTAPILIFGVVGVLISLGLARPFTGRKAARAKAGA